MYVCLIWTLREQWIHASISLERWLYVRKSHWWYIDIWKKEAKMYVYVHLTRDIQTYIDMCAYMPHSYLTVATIGTVMESSIYSAQEPKKNRCFVQYRHDLPRHL